MAASKQQRILTGTPGAFKQYRTNDDKNQWNGNKVYPWWVPGYWNFYTQGGYNQSMVGNHQYWITSNKSGEEHEGIRFNHKDDIFSVQSKSKNGFSKGNSNSVSYVNKGGYNFSFNNNVEKSSDKNGFAYEVTTKDKDYIGGSPMPVVGICFRMFADGNGLWNASPLADEAVVGSRSHLYTGEGSINESIDLQINRMHLCYKDYNSGVIFSHAILPEGNNAGDIQFYNQSKWSSSKNIKEYLKDKTACSSEKALLIRAWHTEDLPETAVFIGFTLHLFVGKRANINKVHSCHIGGMSPILKGDLEVITSAGKNKHGKNQAVAWQPPITSKTDLDSRFDPNQGQKLVLFDDPGGNNGGTNTSYAPIGGNWKRSINVKDNSAIFKY